MAQFRTYNEVNEIYNKLSHLPGKGHPYCITLHKPNRYFGFIGTSHTPDSNHHQWGRFFKEWEIFLNSKNTNKIILHEGRSIAPEAKTKEEAIKKGADNGLTVWLAQKHSIDYLSPEPNRADEIKKLKDKGFTDEELVIYYIGRSLAQWLRIDRANWPRLDEYISSNLSFINKNGLQTKYTNKEVRKMIENQIKIKNLELVTRDQIYQIATPGVNDVASSCFEIRNKNIFNVITQNFKQGKDIFCVYGSGHAIVLEPALKELINGV